LGIVFFFASNKCVLRQVALLLYMHLGNAVLLQLEAFLCKLLLPLAEGKGAPGVGRQEAALEVSYPQGFSFRMWALLWRCAYP
jgi:hypothetical protein